MFIGSHSAKGAMHELEMLTNNLANVNTTGFRADHQTFKPIDVKDKNMPSRSFAAPDKIYTDFTPGPILNTGRDLDLSVSGKGFIAVQSKTGQEGYTRAGELQIQNNMLTTASGQLVMGSSGPISIGANIERVNIGLDGTISAKLIGQTAPIALDKIKLVSPPIDQLSKGTDGLFYLPGGQSVQPDTTLRVQPGTIEGSNVNPIEALTSLIELSRAFEMRTSLLSKMSEQASKGNQLLEVSR